MTIAEFQAWLKGYTEGKKLTDVHAKRIVEEAEKITEPYQPPYIPLQPLPVYPPPWRPWWDQWTTSGPTWVVTPDRTVGDTLGRVGLEITSGLDSIT